MRISDWSSDVCSSDLCSTSKASRHNLGEVMFPGGATSMGVSTGFPFDPDNLVLVELWRQPAVRPLRSLGRHTNIDRRLLECSPGGCRVRLRGTGPSRSDEHTSELQSLLRISYAV